MRNTKRTIREYLATKKQALREFIKYRYLYCIAFIFDFIAPLILIGFKVFSVRAAALTPSVSVSFGGMIVGIIYFAFVAKKVKTKIEAMEQGAAKILFKGVQGIIPFAVAAFIFQVIEKALEGAAVTAWCVIACLAAGTVMQMIDWEVNKDYLYAQEIEKLAKKQADIEVRKAQLIAQQREENEEDI
jgi:hypothetical protein